MNEIVFTVKPPINLNIESLISKHKNDKFKNSGCSVLDVIFRTGSFYNISQISFKNNYTAFITVKYRSRNKKNTQWKTAIRSYRLMSDPNANSGGEKVYTFTRCHFLEELIDVFQMRFILQQPSCLWRDHNINKLKIFNSSNNSLSSSTQKLTNSDLTTYRAFINNLNLHNSSCLNSNNCLYLDSPQEPVDPLGSTTKLNDSISKRNTETGKFAEVLETLRGLVSLTMLPKYYENFGYQSGVCRYQFDLGGSLLHETGPVTSEEKNNVEK